MYTLTYVPMQICCYLFLCLSPENCSCHLVFEHLTQRTSSYRKEPGFVFCGKHLQDMSFLNGNWQSQYVLFIKMLQFFGPSASIYCTGAPIICPNATIVCSSARSNWYFICIKRQKMLALDQNMVAFGQIIAAPVQ